MLISSFDKLTQAPCSSQIKYLLKMLRKNKLTEYGQKYDFAKIHNERDFRKYVPIIRYQDLEPYIDKCVNGHENVLTSDKITMFNTTSGTSDRPKYIPVNENIKNLTASLMRQWLCRTLLDHPSYLDKYLLLIAGSATEGYTCSNVPFGSLSGLINNTLPPEIISSYALPSTVADIKSYDLRYFVMARLAIEKDISFAATPNPLTLIRVAETGIKYQDEIVRSIHDGCLCSGDIFQINPSDAMIIESLNAALRQDKTRAKFLGSIIQDNNRLLPRYYWPSLKVVGCWLGGSIGYHSEKLTEFYGDVPRRDLGLLASEGCITLPYEDSTASGILALQNNFYEFIPEKADDGGFSEVLLSHELEAGNYYKIILTNESGLYRYDINDTVKVERFYNSTPVLSFVRKTADVLNITGEKVHVNQLMMTFQRIASEYNIAISQFRVVSNLISIRYDIFLGLDSQPPFDLLSKSVLPAIDSLLKRINIEYALKRETKRLNPPCLHIMDSSWVEDVKINAAESRGRDIQSKWNILSPEFLEIDQKHVMHTIYFPE